MTPTQRKAMEQALEFIENHSKHWNGTGVHPQTTVIDLRAVLAEQPAEQEPAPGYCKHCKQYTIEEPLPAEQEQEPVSFIEPEADNDCAYAYADGWNACLLARKHTAPHTDMHPFLVRDLAELIGSTVPDVCNALEAMGIEPRRSTNAAVTPDEALAVARRLAQPAKPAEQEPETQGWQPIETAPKDGTVVDLWHEEFGREADCYWGLPHHCCGEMGSLCDSDWHDLEPGWVGTFNEIMSPASAYTHWMPLPEAPNAASEASKPAKPAEQQRDELLAALELIANTGMDARQCMLTASAAIAKVEAGK